MVLLFTFVLMFSFGNVSAVASDDGDSGFFAKFWNFFKGLFGEGEKPRTSSTDRGGDGETIGNDFLDQGLDGDDVGGFLEGGDDVQIIFGGPTEVGIGEPVTYSGSVTGTDTCTLFGTSLSDCSSFAEDFTFSVAGTYPITLAAGGKTETIMLVVEGSLEVEGEENASVEANESVEVILNGENKTGVDEPVTYVGSVTGTDICTLRGVPLDDCSFFTHSFTFSIEGVYPITLAAGGKTETIMLLVEGGASVISGGGSGTSAPSSAVDTTTNMNAKPVDDGSKDAKGWPAYLNVPEYCDGPEPGEVYTYSAPRYGWLTSGVPTVGPVEPSATTGPIQVRMFRDGAAGQNYKFIMGRQEVYALPFYSVNFNNWGMPVQSGISTGDGRLVVGLSECPGDFDRQDGAPQACSASAITIGSLWSATTNTTLRQQFYDYRTCLIEPGKRYFLNLRMSDTVGYGCIAKPETGVCSTVGSIKNSFMFDRELSYPPYTGPCLTEGPYPVNYKRSQCYNPNYVGAYSDGRCAMGGEIRGRPEGSTRDWTCTDGVGGEVLAEYTFSCQGGRYIATDGKDIPATPNMVCTQTSTFGSTSTLDGCLLSYRELAVHDISVVPLGGKKHMFYPFYKDKDGGILYREWTCGSTYIWGITDYEYSSPAGVYSTSVQFWRDRAKFDTSNRWVAFEA